MSLIDNIFNLPIGEKLKVKTDQLKIFIEIRETDQDGFTWDVIDLNNLTAPPIYPCYANQDKRLFFKTAKSAKRNLIRNFINTHFTFGELQEGEKTCSICNQEKKAIFFHKNSDNCRVCYYTLRAEIASLEEQGKSKCTECGKIGEFKEFRKNKSTSSVGVSPICLKCLNKKQREWKQKNER